MMDNNNNNSNSKLPIEYTCPVDGTKHTLSVLLTPHHHINPRANRAVPHPSASELGDWVTYELAEILREESADILTKNNSSSLNNATTTTTTTSDDKNDTPPPPPSAHLIKTTCVPNDRESLVVQDGVFSFSVDVVHQRLDVSRNLDHEEFLSGKSALRRRVRRIDDPDILDFYRINVRKGIPGSLAAHKLMLEKQMLEEQKKLLSQHLLYMQQQQKNVLVASGASASAHSTTSSPVDVDIVDANHAKKKKKTKTTKNVTAATAATPKNSNKNSPTKPQPQRRNSPSYADVAAELAAAAAAAAAASAAAAATSTATPKKNNKKKKETLAAAVVTTKEKDSPTELCSNDDDNTNTNTDNNTTTTNKFQRRRIHLVSKQRAGINNNNNDDNDAVDNVRQRAESIRKQIPCANLSRHGQCRYGDVCRYSHDDVLVAEHRAAVKMKESMLQQQDDDEDDDKQDDDDDDNNDKKKKKKNFPSFHLQLRQKLHEREVAKRDALSFNRVCVDHPKCEFGASCAFLHP